MLWYGRWWCVAVTLGLVFGAFEVRGDSKEDLSRIQQNLLKAKTLNFVNFDCLDPYQTVGTHLEAIHEWVVSDCGGSEKSSCIAQGDQLVYVINSFKDYISRLGPMKKSWARSIQTLVQELSPASQFKKNPHRLEEIWKRSSAWHNTRVIEPVREQQGQSRKTEKIEPEDPNLESEIMIEPIFNPELTKNNYEPNETAEEITEQIVSPAPVELVPSVVPPASQPLGVRPKPSPFVRVKSFISKKIADVRTRSMLASITQVQMEVMKKIRTETKRITAFRAGELRDHLYIRYDWINYYEKHEDKARLVPERFRMDPADVYAMRKDVLQDHLAALAILENKILDTSLDHLEDLLQRRAYPELAKLLKMRDFELIVDAAVDISKL
jgi:hypothetical protein